MEVEPITDNSLLDTKRVQRALNRAVRQALIMHKKLGNPIAVWENGKVVIVPPEEIVIPEEHD